MYTAEISGRLEVPVQTSDAQSDPAHVYINYPPLADLNINSKSAEIEVTVLTSDTKSNSDDQHCSEPDRAEPNLDQPFMTIVSDLVFDALLLPHV